MNLRYKFLRMMAKQKKNKFIRIAKTHTQKLAYDIIKKSIANSESELLLAPISNVYYIKMDNLFIKILDTHVQIVNGKYFYHISMPDLLMSDIDKRFRTRMESKKKIIENKISNNTSTPTSFSSSPKQSPKKLVPMTPPRSTPPRSMAWSCAPGSRHRCTTDRWWCSVARW